MVFVPPSFFEKVSSHEKSSVYKCLNGCSGKFGMVKVFHSTLSNARRHVQVSDKQF